MAIPAEHPGRCPYSSWVARSPDGDHPSNRASEFRDREWDVDECVPGLVGFVGVDGVAELHTEPPSAPDSEVIILPLAVIVQRLWGPHVPSSYLMAAITSRSSPSDANWFQVAEHVIHDRPPISHRTPPFRPDDKVNRYLSVSQGR